jgi:hypothetical protein
MAGPTSANYVFLPWVRQGAAASIQAPDSLGASQAGVVSVPVRLRVNDTDDIDQQVRLYGPGDITGIDPQQVVRMEPRHLATDFEPNYFPAIDFDRPDFPWLFTPAKAGEAGRLRPWLCLVVVQQQAGVTLRGDRGLPLSVLDISAPAQPARELPDLSESWAWAHAQVTGSQPATDALRQALAGNPALTVSRLVCPRRLDPLTEYLACVVPAFDLGRKAGLGLPIAPDDEQALRPAWASGPQAQAQVTLPVYLYWEFRTGAGGDFETLVRLLEARKMPKEAGRRAIEISQPGFMLTPALPEPTTLEIEGALRVTDAPPADWPDGAQARFQTALKPILDAPAQAMSAGTNDPLLAPPIYGSWQAARHTVNVPPSAQTWLDELNLDPRQRAIAALGTQVVQAQQEPLMAAAWEQLGEIERVNQLRRQAQLARAVNGVYHAKHFSRFSDETLLKVVAPAQSRVVVETTGPTNVPARALLSHRIAQSSIPASAVSAPLRRLTSPRGVVSSRFQAASPAPIAIVARLNTSALVQPTQPAGLATIDQVSDQAIAGVKQSVRFENASQALDSGPQLGRFKIAAEGDANTVLSALFPMISGGSPVGLADNPDAQAFRSAAKAHMQYLTQRAFVSFLTFPAPPLDLPDTKAQLLRHLDPEITIAARVQASLSITGSTAPQSDPLEPILDAPSFPQPMYEALRDLSQDHLFPGLEHVPPNTATVLATNPAFVESFLVGLNAEMSHELLWRNYPTDQRGTYFRQFWEPAAGPGQPPDIGVISTWGGSRLGQNASSGEQLVLLIRGELLRRYPNAVIYAVAAAPNGGQPDLSNRPEDELHPLFRGTLKPDITFLGFNLNKDIAIADPGWFFVIQEQPTEPRFGMDAADFDAPLPELTTWNALSWRHLANTPEQLQALSHASVTAALPIIDKAEWGRNSAHQAYITLQRPVRIAIHAKDMIPK